MHVCVCSLPASLAGPLAGPQGIPIFDQDQLEATISSEGVDRAVMSYSDLSYGEASLG